MNENAIPNVLEYLVANLLDFFRDPRTETRFLHAASIAENLVLRRANKINITVKKRFLFLAHQLNNNISPTSIRGFARACLEYVEKCHFTDNAAETSSAPSMRSLYKKAQAEVKGSLASGHSEAAAVHRAANELVKSQRVVDANTRLRSQAKNHPLKDTLLVLNVEKRPMAKEDIKNHLLKLKREVDRENPGSGVLYHLLKRAEAFSTTRLHHLLGDELFFLCRPLGYLDHQATTLIVEVPSSAHLHALTYRRLEILTALRKDTAFASVKNLKLKVRLSSI
ncbi:MAG TPA: DciA family protein [Myxococcota bacterium]|nr:DciA family protein [Myxococcota bacterium]